MASNASSYQPRCLYYELMTNYQVRKVCMDASAQTAHANLVGHYVWFESEHQWVFVNHPVTSLPHNITYCAHRSHTPSNNWAEVVHRNVVLEQWGLLQLRLADMAQDENSEPTSAKVKRSFPKNKEAEYSKDSCTESASKRPVLRTVN